jgi:ABC-type amino acid transport system permease subunit
MLKDSALVSTIGLLELFRQGELAGRRDFRTIEALIVVAAMYWILTIAFTYFQRRLERRLSRGHVRDVTGRPRAASSAQPGVVAPVPGVAE